MIIHDDIGKELQALMPAAELQGFEDNIKIGLAGEKGKPLDHCAGDEVREVGVPNGITASHGLGGEEGAKQELRQKRAFPSWSLGTRGITRFFFRAR
jgi:hypothetical protein